MKKMFVVLAIASLPVLSTVRAATITEKFFADPSQDGWQIFGDTNLFQWDSTNQNLAVTWDSSQTTSYFYHPLGTVLTTNDDFSIEFDLQLSDAEADGFGNELAIGFLNLGDASSPDFSRADGISPNIAEFDYFPPSMIAPSIDATLIDASNDFYFAFETNALNPGLTYHVRIAHVAGELGITGEVFTNGQLYTSLPQISGAAPADFRLDTISVNSYQDDGFGDTALAHGTVANLVVTLPPIVRNFTGALNNGVWQVQCGTYTNWLYSLERSTNLISWSDALISSNGSGDILFLQDTNAPADKAFYRVRADQP
jgi:hypothetical protein